MPDKHGADGVKRPRRKLRALLNIKNYLAVKHLMLRKTFQCVRACEPCVLAVCVLLTLYGQGDGLAGLILSVLVVYRLDVVASGVGRHRRQNDQRVVQSDGAEEGTRRGEGF
ncbi:hypothetical protein EYF80_053985 [Liparis tanakae]|uniref:Uncharacterized protein n=1 Tax=Liparis tanakae TaxID=230148 RepID=A0A4Z2F4N8_9TELE|nr:hypothetical protein EYF80_053985 [Liparis tanakae]